MNIPQLIRGGDSEIAGRLISEALPRKSANPEVSASPLRSGLLNPNLSWTHYRMPLEVDKPYARSFYEIESTRNGSSRYLLTGGFKSENRRVACLVSLWAPTAPLESRKRL
jgi:hypothetical protein